MPALVVAPVVAREAQPRTRVGRESDAVADQQARAGRQRDFDRYGAPVAVGLLRPHVDVAEVPAVGQRDVQLRELARVVRLAGVKRQVGPHERLDEHVLMDVDFPEHVPTAGVELQHEIRDPLLGIHVDPIHDEPRVGIAALAREVRPTALQLLVRAVPQNGTALEVRRGLRRREIWIRRRLSRQPHVDAANPDRLAERDRERDFPAVARLLERRVDPRLVVTEDFERVANPRGCGETLRRDALLRGVAGFLVEVQIREHVRGDVAVDTGELDGRCGGAGEAERQACEPRRRARWRPCRTVGHGWFLARILVFLPARRARGLWRQCSRALSPTLPPAPRFDQRPWSCRALLAHGHFGDGAADREDRDRRVEQELAASRLRSRRPRPGTCESRTRPAPRRATSPRRCTPRARRGDSRGSARETADPRPR